MADHPCGRGGHTAGLRIDVDVKGRGIKHVDAEHGE
jgi:hypothetical protein